MIETKDEWRVVFLWKGNKAHNIIVIDDWRSNPNVLKGGGDTVTADDNLFDVYKMAA